MQAISFIVFVASRNVTRKRGLTPRRLASSAKSRESHTGRRAHAGRRLADGDDLETKACVSIIIFCDQTWLVLAVMPAQLERPNHALGADVGNADALHQADLADRARTHAACANAIRFVKADGVRQRQPSAGAM